MVILLLVKTQISPAILSDFRAISSAVKSLSISAFAAAKVLAETDMGAEDIARKSIKVASDICVFTNNNITVEKV